MGAARDIVESAGVARFWFSDFPLGHSAGKPHDIPSQAQTLDGALSLLDTASAPRTTAVSPQAWANDNAWKADFMDVSKLDLEQIEKLKAEHEKVRALKAAE